MRKIPSVFKRNHDTGLIYDEVTEGCEWVLAGEGIPTVKWDGTACLVRGGKLYRRYDAKQGKTPPAGFEPAQDEADPITGHFPGWLPVGDEPESKYHREGLLNADVGIHSGDILDGTYELVGPKVQGNPYGLLRHELKKHGRMILNQPNPLTFEGIKIFLSELRQEGIVFHHPDGRMAKAKRKDFGYEWTIK